MNDDLISRSALKMTIMSRANGMEDLWDTAGVLNVINNEPAVELLMGRMVNGCVIPIEGLPSKWIDNGKGYHFCKTCGYFALYQTKDTKTYFEKLSNCCPRCGAKMKGVENDQKDKTQMD